MTSSEETILDALKLHVDQGNFHFYVIDSMVDGEVEDVEVEDSAIDDINVIDAKDGSATVSVVCSLKVSMSVSGDDPDSMWRDEDDDSFHSVWKVNGSIERDIEVTATVQVEYNTDEPGKAAILEVDFNYEEINIEVEEGEVSVDYGDDDEEFDDMLPNDDEPPDDRSVEF